LTAARFPAWISRRIARCRSRFLGSITMAADSDWVLLERYGAVLAALQALRSPRVPFIRTLDRQLRGATSMMIGGRSYRFPSDWKDRLPAIASPSLVTMQLLEQWNLHPQTVKEHVIALRRERSIACAWVEVLGLAEEEPLPSAGDRARPRRKCISSDARDPSPQTV
jgi:hypothetical protein